MTSDSLRGVPVSVEAVCGGCGRPYSAMELPYALDDWENSHERYCIECAAKDSDTQWNTPGDCLYGPAEPGPDAGVVDLFLSFCDADFWTMVWAKRVAQSVEVPLFRFNWVGEPVNVQTPEVQTAARLYWVRLLFDYGEWNLGQRLLYPIGAPAWAASGLAGRRLFAWKPDNCLRAALAWRRLREYRLGCLPASIQSIINSRPPCGPASPWGPCGPPDPADIEADHGAKMAAAAERIRVARAKRKGRLG